MLIAEDLLLLLTDDRTGKLAVSSDRVDVALGGAMLLELALAHRVDVAGWFDSRRADESVREAAGAERVLTSVWPEVVGGSSPPAADSFNPRRSAQTHTGSGVVTPKGVVNPQLE